jgi:hypothetical protein
MYWDDVVSLGSNSPIPKYSADIGAQYISDLPTTVGCASVSIACFVLNSTTALCGDMPEFDAGTTDWCVTLIAIKSLLYGTACV